MSGSHRGRQSPTHRDRLPVPSDLHKAVVRLVLRHGPLPTQRLLQCGPNTVDEARDAHARMMPRTIAKLRARLIELGELVA